MDPRALGAQCDLCPLKDAPKVVPPQVVSPRSKKLALVAEYPGKTEVRRGEFLCGGTGALLDERIFGHLQIPRHAFHETNALLCPGHGCPPKQLRRAIACCAPRLHAELSAVAPDAILSMGGAASGALLNEFTVGKVAGAPTAWESIPVLPTFNPAMLFRDKMNWLPVVRAHVLRAWLLSRGELPAWEWPEFHLEPSPGAVIALQAMLSAPAPLSIDIETPRTKKDFGPFNQAFKIKCIGVSNLEQTVCLPWHSYSGVFGIAEDPQSPEARECASLMLQIFESDKVKVLQNGIFDRTVLRTHGVRVAPPFFDLLHAHLILAPGTPHKLDHQACWELHAPRWKQEFRGSSGAASFDK